MNKEELDGFESLDIVLNDVDDLSMGLEVISYKARVCIQELSKLVMEQSSKLQAYKDKEDKLRELFIKHIDIDCIHDTYTCGQQDLAIKILEILNEGDK